MSHEQAKQRRVKSPEEVADQILRISNKLSKRARMLDLPTYSTRYYPKEVPSYNENYYGDRHVLVKTGDEEEGYGASYLHLNSKANSAHIRWVTKPQISAKDAESQLYGSKQKSIEVKRKKSKILKIKGPAEFSSYDGPASFRNRREITKEDVSEVAVALSAMRGSISEHKPETASPETKAA